MSLASSFLSFFFSLPLLAIHSQPASQVCLLNSFPSIYFFLGRVRRKSFPFSSSSLLTHVCKKRREKREEGERGGGAFRPVFPHFFPVHRLLLSHVCTPFIPEYNQYLPLCPPMTKPRACVCVCVVCGLLLPPSFLPPFLPAR